jgi:uncharacterized protein
MLNNVMPQRGVFFSLLATHTDHLMAAANATLRLVTGLGNANTDIDSLIAEVNVCETNADDVKEELIKLLYSSFTTPINRDQIHTLTLDLDRVIDNLQSVANSVSMQHITSSTARGRQLATLGSDACIRLNSAVLALGSKERVAEIVSQCKEVDDIYDEATEVMRMAITELFANADDKDEAAAWNAMKMHRFYFMQAGVLGASKQAAKILEEILLENA